MLAVIFKSLFCFFAVLGLTNIAKRFICAFFVKSPPIKNDVFVVLKIKKQASCVEGIVRSVIWRSLSADGGGFVPSILIVDMGTDAETREIAKRLCSEYGFIYYTTNAEYEGMRKGFLKN